MPTLKSVVHFLLVDFGGGCYSLVVTGGKQSQILVRLTVLTVLLDWTGVWQQQRLPENCYLCYKNIFLISDKWDIILLSNYSWVSKTYQRHLTNAHNSRYSLQNCHTPNNNTTQPQHNLNTTVRLNMKRTVHSNPPHLHHSTTQTQQQPSCASD